MVKLYLIRTANSMYFLKDHGKRFELSEDNMNSFFHLDGLRLFDGINAEKFNVKKARGWLLNFSLGQRIKNTSKVKGVYLLKEL